MRRGERAALIFSPTYAFGAAGAPPRIPPNATVTCDLTLVGWAAPAARRAALAERYTPSSAPEEHVYDKYRAELGAGNLTQVMRSRTQAHSARPASVSLNFSRHAPPPPFPPARPVRPLLSEVVRSDAAAPIWPARLKSGGRGGGGGGRSST